MSRPGVVTVLQARTGSTRLPGKVLLPLGGGNVLSRLLQRVQGARLTETIVVATTTDVADDVIATQVGRLGVAVFRGHPTDLLDRHYQSARAMGARHVVKIPSDCPLIDPAAIDDVIGWYLDRVDQLDYASNLHPASWPDGNDVEIMSFTALETAWREASKPHEREHTTPFLWDQPERFRIGNVAWMRGEDCSATHRYVLDYPEDYEVIREIDGALAHPIRTYGAEDVVAFLDRNPAIAARNGRYRGVSWYRHYASALRTVPASVIRHPTEVG